MTKLDKSTPTVSDLAKKHQSTVAAIKKQLAMGRKVEREHTSNAAAADEIARDHLGEKPDYYSKLKKAHLEEDEDPCWDGYQQYGMKMKGGRKVPNCVPKKKNKLKVAEETTMNEEREIISEAIESIIDNRLADMKEQFLAALNEKAMMKLDERKQEIAESMFED